MKLHTYGLLLSERNINFFLVEDTVTLPFRFYAAKLSPNQRYRIKLLFHRVGLAGQCTLLKHGFSFFWPHSLTVKLGADSPERPGHQV